MSHAGRITLNGQEVKSVGSSQKARVERVEYTKPPASTLAERRLDALGSVSAKRKQFERDVRAAVGAARRAGATWVSIGRYLGTSSEAARQRYGGKKRDRKSGRATSAGARSA